MKMQTFKNIYSKKQGLLSLIVGLFVVSTSTSYAVFESLDQRKYNARRLLTPLVVKYNQSFEEIPTYQNKECAIEFNLVQLGFDVYFIDEVTTVKLEEDIHSLYHAAWTLKPWNPFSDMDADTLMLYNELLNCAYKAERVIYPIIKNYTFIQGCQIYHSYNGLPLQSYDMSTWICSRMKSGYYETYQVLLKYESTVMKDVRFIDSFNSFDRAAYPYLYDKLRSLRYEIIASIDRLKCSYEYQQALYYKQLEDNRIAEQQRIEREREYRAKIERQLLEIRRERYELEATIQDLQWQQAFQDRLYRDIPYFELHYVPSIIEYLTIDQIIAENVRLQAEIDYMNIFNEWY